MPRKPSDTMLKYLDTWTEEENNYFLHRLVNVSMDAELTNAVYLRGALSMIGHQMRDKFKREGLELKHMNMKLEWYHSQYLDFKELLDSPGPQTVFGVPEAIYFDTVVRTGPEPKTFKKFRMEGIKKYKHLRQIFDCPDCAVLIMGRYGAPEDLTNVGPSAFAMVAVHAEEPMLVARMAPGSGEIELLSEVQSFRAIYSYENAVQDAQEAMERGTRCRFKPVTMGMARLRTMMLKTLLLLEVNV